MTEPDVTVVVPTRDRWELLSTHALPSAFSQEDVDLEVVVVDDGSTDATEPGLQAIGDRRLRVLRQATPRGVSAARNRGIAAARGSWIAFLDDDDLWSPRKLRLQLDAVAATGAAWAYAAVIVVNGETTPLYALELPSAQTVAAALEHGNVVPGGPSNVIAEAKLLRSLGGFDESLTQGEDWDVWLRLARTGEPAVCTDVLVATLSHGERSIYRYRPDAMEEIERMLAKHRPVTRADRLETAQWLADQYYRGGRRLAAAATYLRAAIAYRSAGNLPPAVAAPFGRRAMRLASRLLVATRGVSHLEQPPPFSGPEPLWLRRYRG